MIWSDQFLIAVGYNNQNNMLPLFQLNPPFFDKYHFGLVFKWHESEARELNAARRHKRIGLPWCEVMIPFALDCEFDWLTANIIPGDDALVSVRLHNTRKNTWDNYNGIFELPEDFSNIYELGDYRNLPLIFRDLRKVV